MASRRWVLVVVDGDGVLENPRVFGPWRSEEKAKEALWRLDEATRDADGFAYGISVLEPEYGRGDRSLSGYIRKAKEALR